MNLGRAIWTRSDLSGLVASHDLIRICPDAGKAPPGFLYAFLACRYGHSQIRRQIYGGHIKHVEPHHIADLLVPRLGHELERRVHELVEEAAAQRAHATETLTNVAAQFDALTSDIETTYPSPQVTSVPASSIQRRFDAQYHDPVVQAIRTRLAATVTAIVPQLAAASPMLQTTMPGCRFTRLKSADPTEISADPPTMALFGKMPNGVKKACMEPPMPLLKPASRPNISASAP